MRSLSPSLWGASADSLISARAGAMKSPAGPVVPARWASDSEAADDSLSMAARSFRLAPRSSMVLASQIVHVTTEASARPMMTHFTTGGADMNMPHGVSSRGAAPAPMTEAGPGSVWAHRPPAGASHPAAPSGNRCHDAGPIPDTA